MLETVRTATPSKVEPYQGLRGLRLPKRSEPDLEFLFLGVLGGLPTNSAGNETRIAGGFFLRRQPAVERAELVDSADMCNEDGALCGIEWRGVRGRHLQQSEHRMRLVTALVSQAAEVNNSLPPPCTASSNPFLLAFVFGRSRTTRSVVQHSLLAEILPS